MPCGLPLQKGVWGSRAALPGERLSGRPPVEALRGQAWEIPEQSAFLSPIDSVLQERMAIGSCAARVLTAQTGILLHLTLKCSRSHPAEFI